MQKTAALTAALWLVLFIGASVRAEEEAPGIKVGEVAPALEGKWLTKDGKTPELKGKVYLLDFWFEGWRACVEAMPELTKMAEKYAAKGLVVVAPSLDVEAEVKRFRIKHKLDFAMLSDAEKTSEKYKVEAFPTMFIVGKDGKVAWKGHFKDDAMIKKLEAELDKKWMRQLGGQAMRSTTPLLALALMLAAPAFAVEVGDVAPAIEGSKWFTKDGKAPDLKGKVHVIEFWFAGWGPCNSAVPKLKEIATKYAEKGLVMVAPSLDAEAGVQKFKDKHKIEEYALLAGARKTAKAFAVQGYPTAFIVGKDGKVLWKGHHPNKEFTRVLEEALSK